MSGTVRIGVQATLDADFFVHTFGPTMAYLRKNFPDLEFHSELFSPEKLDRKTLGFDFFFADSGVFAYERSRSGARDIAARTRMEAADPSEAVSAVFLVRADDRRFKKIEDLKGAEAALEDPDSFDGWLVAAGEIRRLGFDPETFFKGRIFTRSQLPDPLSLLFAGVADVAVLRACELERQLLQHGLKPAAFRVLSPKTGGGLRCLHSTALYPNTVFASLPSADAMLVRAVTVALLTAPVTEAGLAWGVCNDFGSVDELYRLLAVGPYRHLREMNWDVFWTRYGKYVGLLALAAAFGFLHILRVNRLIDLRTKELREALRRRDELEEEARESRQRLSNMERAGVVSQMSAMLAHEVRQPVAAIVNFAGGLRQYLKRKGMLDSVTDEASAVIEAEAQRLSGIVDRVRSYSRKKGKGSDREVLSVSSVAEAALRTFRHSTTSGGISVKTNVPDDILVEGSPLELELVLLNLLKNGAAAMKNSPRKEMILRAMAEDDVKITVDDFGPPVSDEVFNHLSEPVKSLKEDGLGLGLSLAKTIAERHGGHLFFRRRKDGLQAGVSLPPASEMKE